jgi:hypothetical protein
MKAALFALLITVFGAVPLVAQSGGTETYCPNASVGNVIVPTNSGCNLGYSWMKWVYSNGAPCLAVLESLFTVTNGTNMGFAEVFEPNPPHEDVYASGYWSTVSLPRHCYDIYVYFFASDIQSELTLVNSADWVQMNADNCCISPCQMTLKRHSQSGFLARLLVKTPALERLRDQSGP